VDPHVQATLAAREARCAYPPPSATTPLSADEAYRAQERVREALVARGERVVGWKVGFTTPAVQEAFGWSEPVCAFLLASGMYGSGADVPWARFVNLAVEAEIAFLMRADLAGPGVTPPRALLAVEGALPALELVDFRHQGTPTGTDVIADGVYANAVVLGGAVTPLAGLDLAREGLVYEHNGAVAATAAAAEVMGNPVHALAWVANHLGTRGLRLHAGDVVMSGSVSKLLHPKAGDSVRATFTRLGSVTVRFV